MNFRFLLLREVQDHSYYGCNYNSLEYIIVWANKTPNKRGLETGRGRGRVRAGRLGALHPDPYAERSERAKIGIRARSQPGKRPDKWKQQQRQK